MRTDTVKVAGDEMGNVVGISTNNNDYGYIRVEQTTPVIDGGWLRLNKRSALIKGKYEELKALDLQKGQSLPGKIVIRESLTPFNTKDPLKNLKIAGDTGISCTIDDQPIYREAFYTTDMSSQDELIQHNNTEEIRRAQGAMKAMAETTAGKEAVL